MVVAPSSAPEFAMPAAGWAAKAGDPVLWADRDALPAATKAAITAHRRPRIYVLGPASVISDAVLKQLGELGTARRISGARARRQRDRLRALHRRPLRLERRRPRPRLRVREHQAPRRRGGRVGALGRRHLRPAAARRRAQSAAAPAPGVPARHPARLRRGPRARGLQPRLDRRRREGDLGRRAVAHRRAARDPARAAGQS